MSEQKKYLVLLFFIFFLCMPSAWSQQWIAEWEQVYGTGTTLVEQYPHIFETTHGAFTHPAYDEVRRLLNEYPKEYRDELLDDYYLIKNLDEDYRLLRDFFARHPEAHPSHPDNAFDRSPTMPTEIEGIVDGTLETFTDEEAYRLERRRSIQTRTSERQLTIAAYLSDIWGERNKGVRRVMINRPGFGSADSAASNSNRNPSYRTRGALNGMNMPSPIDVDLLRLQETAMEALGGEIPTPADEAWVEAQIPNGPAARNFAVEQLDFATYVLPHLAAIVVERQRLRDATEDSQVLRRRALDRVLIYLLGNQISKRGVEIWVEVEAAHSNYLIAKDKFPGYVKDRRFVPLFREEPQLGLTYLPQTPRLLGRFSRFYAGIFDDANATLQTESGREALEYDLEEKQLFDILDSESRGYEARLSTLYRQKMQPAVEDEETRWLALEALLNSPAANLQDQNQVAALNAELAAIYSDPHIVRLRGRALTLYNLFKQNDQGSESKLVRWRNAGLWLRGPENFLLNEEDLTFSEFQQRNSGQAAGAIGFSGSAMGAPLVGPKQRDIQFPRITWRTPRREATLDAINLLAELIDYMTTGAALPDPEKEAMLVWRENYRADPIRANSVDRPLYHRGLEQPFRMNITHPNFGALRKASNLLLISEPKQSGLMVPPLGIVSASIPFPSTVDEAKERNRMAEEKQKIDDWYGDYLAKMRGLVGEDTISGGVVQPSYGAEEKASADGYLPPFGSEDLQATGDRSEANLPSVAAMQAFYALWHRIPTYWVAVNPFKKELVQTPLGVAKEGVDLLEEVLLTINSMDPLLLDYDLDGVAPTRSDISLLIQVIDSVAIREYQF